MRYIKIPETLLPVSDDFPVGQKLSFKIGVSIDGPILYGYSGLVTEVESVEIDFNLPENVSKLNLS